MSGAWPWLAVAGLGALHGLNPASGWMLAAASGVRAGGVAQVRRALMPIAIGHVASIAVVAFAVTQGLWPDRAYVRAAVAVLLVVAALVRWRFTSRRRSPRPPSWQPAYAGLLLVPDGHSEHAQLTWSGAQVRHNSAHSAP